MDAVLACGYSSVYITAETASPLRFILIWFTMIVIVFVLFLQKLYIKRS